MRNRWLATAKGLRVYPNWKPRCITSGKEGPCPVQRQQAVQTLPTLPTQPFRLELHSVISSRSLRNFRDVAGMEQQKKTVIRLTRKRGTLSSLLARTRHSELFLTPPVGCLTKRRGGSFSYGSWRDSVRFLATRS